MTLPSIGSLVPRRGYGPLSLIGRAWLLATGWRVRGPLPDLAHAVVVVAPHSSNWDFVHAVAAVFALRLRVSFIGKHTLFTGGLGRFMRWLGGVPVDRAHAEGIAQAAAQALHDSPATWLGIAPEGTRAAGARFKSGFHRIASAAGVPIIPVSINYRRRVIEIHPARMPGDDVDADVDAIRRLLLERGCRREAAG